MRLAAGNHMPVPSDPLRYLAMRLSAVMCDSRDACKLELMPFSA